MDEVPPRGLRARNPFQGITLRSPSHNTGCRNQRSPCVSHRHLLSLGHSKRDESIDLNNPKSKPRPKNSGKDSPELRVVGIHFNPAPDAQDRLHRIFTILLEHAAGEREAAPEDAPADATPDDDAEEED